MLKKSLILGSVFLLVGVSLYLWIRADEQTEQQNEGSYKFTETDDYIKQYQEWLQLPPDQRTEMPLVLEGKDKTSEQFRQEQQARLRADIDRLATGEITVNPFSDILYGENWQDKVDEYKKQNEFNEYVLTSSIVCTTMGGSIYAWWILLWTTRSIIKNSSNLRHRIANRYRDINKIEDDEPLITEVDDLMQDQQQKKSDEKQKDEKQKRRTNLEEHLTASAGSSRQNPIPVKSGFKAVEKAAYLGKTSAGTEKIDRLLSDAKGPELKKLAFKTTTSWGRKNSETKEEKSEPINSAITELTQQVSAIREYAACQQDRLEKLQDGYDWNIVKTFCLRIIRCIDNLENRINRLGKKESKVIHLEEVMDELIFALESSGIEQYEPEINSDYRGQEKYAEAVKDKQENDDPNQTGKIAQVIRPGYQYFINEENVKVVRPAQVKLFA
jgi:molecular chaperone GrpE (heat shock protein)